MIVSAIFYLSIWKLQKSADTRKKLPPLKPILALPTWGQICIVLELQPFEIPDFDLGHPVGLVKNLFVTSHEDSGRNPRITILQIL